MNLFNYSLSNLLSLKVRQLIAPALQQKLLIAFLFSALFLFTTDPVYAINELPALDICDDVTNGGTIMGDEVGCGTPIFDPALITSTTPASGGSNTLEYLWMSTTDDPNGNSTIWNIIPGSEGASFDPEPILQTTYYRRCARRVGCTLWLTESNTVVKEIECGLINIGDFVFFDENNNGIQDANEGGVSGVMVKLKTSGPDGVFGTSDDLIEEMVTTDDSGIYSFTDVAVGTYIIEFMISSLPSGYTFTTTNVGNDDTDSDANSNGQTDSFTVGVGAQDDLSIDAGLILDCDLEISNITGLDPMCNPGNTGIVALSISGGTAPFTYSWSNGLTTQDINNLAAGTYCVTVTDANGCTKNDCVTLTAPLPLTATANFTAASCGSENGSIDISVSGGTLPYTYTWNNGAITQDIINLASGTYCVEITDSNGCKINQCYVINTTSTNSVSINPENSTICPGQSVTLVASGSANSTYTWSSNGGFLSNSDTQTTSYTMNTPGNYTITVTSTTIEGCVASTNAVVTVSPPVNIGGNVSDASCGQNNGTITTMTSNGTTPYSYTWNTGESTANLSGLAADTYCVTIIDSNGCSNNTCFNVNGSNNNAVTISGPGSICPGESITLTANSAGATTYAWSTTGGNLGNPSAQNTTYTMMAPGTYTISVIATNAEGCAATASTTITVNSNPNVSGTVTNAACGDDNGAINLSASGGNAPYVYDWSTGDATANIDKLGAGQYCVTVTDLLGCTTDDCFIIQSTSDISVNLSVENIECDSPGLIATNVSGGMAPFTYTWDNGENTSSISVSVPGEYCVMVTDANDCNNMQCATVTAPEEIIIIETLENPTCNNNNGNITLNVNVANPTYSWSTGATTTSIQNLEAGSYTVTVSANGCSETVTYLLINEGELSLNLESMNPSCIDSNNGMATAVTQYSGSGSLMFSWSNGESSEKISDLAEGVYCVTVSSTEGCIATECVDIDAPARIILTENITNTTCGDSNGAIAISANGGNGGFSFVWNTGVTNNSLSNLTAGEYCLTVTDINGCSTNECYTIQNSTDASFDLEVIEIECEGPGLIDITNINGTAPYTYLWNTGETTFFIDVAEAGDYCITVTDANGCSSNQCVTLLEPLEVIVTETVENTTCNNDNGSIALSANIANVVYAWSTGATSSSLQNLSVGTYSVTVTAIESGCSATETYTLVNEGELTLNLDAMNPLCIGENNGMVTAIVQYSGTNPLNYNWSNGATTSKISNLSSGQYCVTVTSTDGCIDASCVTLDAPIGVTANGIVGAAGCNLENGNIKLNIIGGTAPYSFKWDTGATTKDIEDLAPGNYCITICDDAGCTFDGCFTVNGGVDFTSTITTTPIVCFEDNNATAMVSVNGGSAPFTYAWSTGATSSNVDNLAAGNYCVSITDIFGCMDVSCVDILTPDELSLTVTANNTTCNEANGSATVNTDFVTSSITWNGPAGFTASTETINNLSAGTYNVTTTNAAGCSAVGAVLVAASNNLTVNIDPFQNTICPGESINLVSTSTVNSGVSYVWSANGGTFTSSTSSNTNYTIMSAGTYTITLNATDAEGCTSSDNATITVRDPNDPICNPNIDLVNIGDYVWFDGNSNGIQDAGELGIEGIDVKLITAGPDGVFYTADDIMEAIETTDPSGYYLFENVAAGEYIIMFCVDTSTGIEYTTFNTGSNDSLDSDANPLNGKTDPFTIVAGQEDDLSFDAGVILSPSGCDNITDAGDICCDQVLCGPGSIPDLIANTTLPSGGSGEIEYLWMTTTVGGPFDMDTWDIIPGATSADYQPGAITQTTFIARCARRVGCTSYRETSIIKLEVVPSIAVVIESLPAFICVGESDMFNASNSGAGVTYTWNLGEGASPENATGQFLTNIVWNTTGSKTITLTVSNMNCTYVITRMVQVGSCLNQPTSDRFTNLTAVNIPETMDVDLNWNTKSGMNDFKFVVEHSTEGENFTIIETIDGNDAFEIKNYSYIDNEARPGRNYYRIKHINNSGRTEKSEMRMVVLSDQSTNFILFPNPTQDFIIFESLALTDEPGSIMISDIKGVVLKEVVIDANTKRKAIDITDFLPGLYTVYIKYYGGRSITKMIYKSDK